MICSLTGLVPDRHQIVSCLEPNSLPKPESPKLRWTNAFPLRTVEGKTIFLDATLYLLRIRFNALE